MGYVLGYLIAAAILIVVALAFKVGWEVTNNKKHLQRALFFMAWAISMLGISIVKLYSVIKPLLDYATELQRQLGL
jgi:hypothetical protein